MTCRATLLLSMSNADNRPSEDAVVRKSVRVRDPS